MVESHRLIIHAGLSSPSVLILEFSLPGLSFLARTVLKELIRCYSVNESCFESCIHLSVRWKTTSRNFVDFGVGVKTETKFDVGVMPGCGGYVVVN